MTESRFARDDIPGWGVDRPEDRPGVPKERKATAHLVRHAPVQQTSEPIPFIGSNRELTPVYSTASPARGLSGIMRRAAYEIPDYNPKRWMLLMASDRVDALEHGGLAKVLVGVSLAVIGLSIVKILRATAA